MLAEICSTYFLAAFLVRIAKTGVNVKSVDSEGNTPPYSLWGKATRSIAEGRWNVAARFDCDSEDLRCLDLDVRVGRDDGSTKARVQGTVDAASRTGEVTELGLSQSLDVLGGNLVLAPGYRVPARRADLVVSYEIQDTKVTVGGGMDKQRVTISQKFGNNNAIAPTVTSEGEVDLEYRRKVGNGVVTAAYKPNDALSVKYAEGPWVATVEAPLDGFYKIDEGGAKVSLRRAIQVETF
jgi:hypothetical protein